MLMKRLFTNPLQRSRASLLLAVLAALGLAYDAYVHLHLADTYDGNGDSITQGGLFRVEAVIAILVALAVLASDHRLVWAAAGLTPTGSASHSSPMRNTSAPITPSAAGRTGSARRVVHSSR